MLQKEERVVFVDYIRVVACFLVMLVHASENFYSVNDLGIAGNVSMLANEANRFWVSFYDGFCGRISVPLFMVVSSFLLVPMKGSVSMTSFYKRRFKRILPPFILFLLLYTTLPLVWNGMTCEQSLADLKMLLWNFPSMAGHLWFMYPLISLYIIIPVVSPWLAKSRAKDERIFLYFFIISTFLPFIHRFIGSEVWGECFWNGFSMLWYCSGFLGYLVLAHYIRVHIKWNTKQRLVIGLITFTTGALFTAWSFWFKGVPGIAIESPALEWAWEFCTPNILLATFGVFLLFSCIRQTRAPKHITTISKLSFGMYLMHMFFLSNISNIIIGGDSANPLIPVWCAIPLIALLTFICCIITTKVLSFLPGSKWVVGASHKD